MENQTTPTPEPAPEVPKKSKTSWIILVVVILIATLAVTLVLLQPGLDSDEEVVVEVPKASVTKEAEATPTPTSVPEEDEYEGWQIYQDTKSRYEFRYPGDWECDYTEQIPNEGIADGIVACHRVFNDKTGVVPSIQVQAYTVFTEENARGWFLNNAAIDGEIMGTPVPVEPNIEIADVKGFRADYTEYGVGGSESGVGLTVVFMKDEVIYRIYGHIREDGTGADEIEKILRSFSI